MDFRSTLGGWWTVEVETKRTMMDLTWDLEGIDGQSLRLGGQRSERMGGEDIGMSAIQKIRPRPSSDKFSVSKYCLHTLTKIVLSLLPRQIPGSQIWIFVTMFSTQIWPEEDVEKQVACILNMGRNLNTLGKWVQSQENKFSNKTIRKLTTVIVIA